MELILTEKPSVAGDFAKTLGASKKEGYYEGSGYIITYCVGHLLQLRMPEEYDDKWKKWSLTELPIVPERYRYRPVDKTKKQLATIKSLVARSDVDSVTIATDAGREGELIGRLVLLHAGIKDFSGVLRFWSSDALDENAILAGMKARRSDAEYDYLFKQASARQVGDWSVGMNISRALSVGLNAQVSYGRVQTAVLGMICDRERAIEEFKPTPFYKLRLDMSRNNIGFSGWYEKDGERKFPGGEAVLPMVLDRAQKAGKGLVRSAEREEKKVAPPRLFSLNGLQREANKRLSWSADKTLKIAQSLYETQKCLTYPRTPSECLSEEDFGAFSSAVEGLVSAGLISGDSRATVGLSQDNKRLFDRRKVEDHHALFAKRPVPEGASADEKALFELVIMRMRQALAPSHEYDAVRIVIAVGEDEFTVNGRIVRVPGWKSEAAKEEPEEESDEASEVPDIDKGDEVSITGGEVTKGMTTPPKRFSEGALLAAMEKPGRYVDKDEESGPITSLGTPATWASIIETLVKRELIAREKKAVVPAHKGRFLWDFIRDETRLHRLAKVEQTTEWERRLKDDPDGFRASIHDEVEAIVKVLKAKDWDGKRFEREAVGVCPKCGGNVIANKKAYGCANWKDTGCDFKIWRTIAGANITESDVRALLSGRKTRRLKCKRKDGTPFESRLVLEDGNTVFVRENEGRGEKSPSRKGVTASKGGR